jgi:succinyl-CoA synthetase beta subunit
VEALGGKAIMKVQAWTTSRKAQGGVVIVEGAQQARDEAQRLLSMTFGNFPVTFVLVEQLLDIAQECFVSLTIDDAARRPLLLFDPTGGSGIEDRAESVAQIGVDLSTGVDETALRAACQGLPTESIDGVAAAIGKIVALAQEIEARSFEVNPLVVLADGSVAAADCRVTIDDYAVFRHPELGIEIARELDHPATALEHVAYAIEQADHRGTFYFAQLPTDGSAESAGVIGFHGAGGGGSMMSMDAAVNEGFTLANFCDTSGNPSAAKVYRAARVILSQPGLVGYFGSGSGVASQEQFHSAYGLAKAFNELTLSIPTVIRLGGNSEDRAVEILEDACRDLPATVEGYRKDDTPAKCAARFAELVSASQGTSDGLTQRKPNFVNSPGAVSHAFAGGTLWMDAENWDETASQIVLEHGGEIFAQGADDLIELAIPEEDLAKRDSELVACEVECRRAGRDVFFVELDIEGLDAKGEVHL